MGPANNDVVIELRNVSKRFGAQAVLRAVNLQLRAGQTTVCIGESGIGKSVLLRHIIGLLTPDEGEVYFHGQRIDTMGDQQLVAVRKRFGYLFQMGALFDSMTVGDNVAFPLQEHTDYPRGRIREIVREKLGLVGLAGLEAKKPAELSGGQRKRVALARAIALDPEVILYDEPTTGLDPIRAEGINELIVKFKRDRGVTGVVVTHDLNTAYAVADRILMLHDGNFIIDGTPEQIRRCRDPRVRAFLQASGYKPNQAGSDGQ
jgi:phospholipid/cholesterol/gamma-HCH transport system ATP-binding protein